MLLKKKGEFDIESGITSGLSNVIMGTGVGDPRCACILLLSHTSNISTPSLPGTQTFHPYPNQQMKTKGC